MAEKGYVRNTYTENKVPERDQTNVRLTGLFPVAYNGELILSYQYDDLEIHGDSFQLVTDENDIVAAIDPNVIPGMSLRKQTFTSFGKNGEAIDEQSGERAYISYEHELGSYKLTSLTGLSEYDNQRVFDSDFATKDYLSVIADQDFSQFTQEFRLTSSSSQRFAYVGGLFYLDSDFDLSEILDAAFPPPFTLGPLPLTGARSKSYRQNTRVISVFVQSTIDFGQRYAATVGLRWNDEEKDALFANTHLRTSPGIGIISPEVAPTSLKRREDNLDGFVNLQYMLRDSAMLYGSWARGSKSGGFSTAVSYPADAEYDTEEAETTEVGLKTQLIGGSAILNLAIFRTEIDDFQVVRFTGLGFETTTIPVVSDGIEFESQWFAAENLLLTANATYVDATEDSTGDEMPGAPAWSANVTARYERALGIASLRWRFIGSLEYMDKRYTDRGEKFQIDSNTFLDLRLALLPSSDRWELALVARNLLDEKIPYQFDYPIFGGNNETTTVAGLNRPRTLAIQGRYHF
jgi:iron complex outermembrane receptor protein